MTIDLFCFHYIKSSQWVRIIQKYDHILWKGCIIGIGEIRSYALLIDAIWWHRSAFYRFKTTTGIILKLLLVSGAIEWVNITSNFNAKHAQGGHLFDYLQVACNKFRGCLNVKTIFPGVRISFIKIGQLWGGLIFIMGIPVLVRQHFYFKTPLSLCPGWNECEWATISCTEWNHWPSANEYCQTSNLRHTKSQTLNVPPLVLQLSKCLIHWSQVLSREWRCSWGSADKRCSNCIWVSNNFVAN